MAKNSERRKRVMQRSIRLGHCVCDPAQPCPCDLFKAKDICLCAGERLEAPQGPIALTQLVEKAGCASKIDQAFLKATLSDLPTVDDPRVLVGMPAIGEKLQFEAVDLADNSQHILGSKMGSTQLHVDLPKLVELYQQGRLKLDELITARYPLEEINEAIAAVKRGEALRNVIVF